MTNATRISGLPDKPSTLVLTDAAADRFAGSHLGGTVDAAMLAVIAAEHLHSGRTAGWRTLDTSGEWKLEADIISSYRQQGESDEILYRVLDGIGLLRVTEKSVRVKVAAPSPAAALAVENWFRQRFPEHVEEDKFKGKVLTRVIWQGHDGYPEEFSRNIDSEKFIDVERNYAESTRNSMAELLEFRPPSKAGRLVLFHGAPGTGKTHAILSLAAEWREWADLMMISDPERLMSDPSYLLKLIRTPESARGTKAKFNSNRWQVLVLEDAGEFLAPTAKVETGQALSRLLNITDGIVGRASQSLLLITTNENSKNLHPAVSRPGRCMAEIEFNALNRAEIAAWCADRELETPDRDTMTLAELYAATRGKEIVSKPQSKIGFAA
ncbi:MAG: AAA family ATPase [Actinobacteria bacterium]|uniref:Unannotated protein n=1 Tax=freshwater metagenome TaxID=449393 RepID=A0A6J7EJ06_9ZZZZ|nr:AAA family ATPase [Actinomycetota bacterium]